MASTPGRITSAFEGDSMEWDSDVVRDLERMSIYRRERLRARVEAVVLGEGRARVTADDLRRARAAGMEASRGRPELLAPRPWPVLAGSYEVVDETASVAVCTLASAELVAKLGRPAGACIVGRAFTENLGVEKLAINIVANPAIRSLILCGTESRHRVGETIEALHGDGLDARGRVNGSTAPAPVLRNFPAEAQRIFHDKLELIDLIDENDVEAVRAAIDAAAARALPPWPEAWTPPRLRRLDASAAAGQPRSDDAAGFLLISLGAYRDRIVVEHYSVEAKLREVFEGRSAEILGRAVMDAGAVRELGHAAYLGRELAKAELALRRGLVYEQDRDLPQA